MTSRWHDLPNGFWPRAAREGSVLLHSAKPDAAEHVSWLYTDPVETLVLQDPQETRAFFEGVEARRRQGAWLAGYVAYEAGYALVGVDDPPDPAYPLAWFGAYEGAWRFDHLTGEIARVGAKAVGSPKNSLREERASTEVNPGSNGLALATGDTQNAPRFGDFGLDEATYRDKLERIHAYLSAGDTYQVNFTDRFEADFDGDLLELYRALIAGQPVPYAAFVNSKQLQVASLSPELFFRVSGRNITTRPMKGTAPRGRDNAEDAALAQDLKLDEKSRAENVMIVDLLRNDLGRVCEHGSVSVPELFAVERYRTVQQMTSTVTGTLRPDVGLPELFGALFPCGSVTGAPKRRTMQIIRELERGPRGVYTGAIGHVSPDGDATFNVAIRTLVQARVQTGGHTLVQTRIEATPTTGSTAKLVLGAGGGIVADSRPSDEYRECLLKARFAKQPAEPFELIETLRWEGSYRFLDEHLARLKESAAYFGFAFDEAALREELGALHHVIDAESPATLSAQKVYRIGIRLPANGAFRVTAEPFTEGPNDASSDGPIERSTDRPSERPTDRPIDRPIDRLRVAISEHTIDSRDPHRRHKTTRRELYVRETARARDEGLADVLFFNERGELAEGAISNVFLEIGGELLTPSVDCGALPGVFRAHVLATHPNAREAVLSPEDLRGASAVWLCNSLRGMRRVRVVDSAQLDSVRVGSVHAG